MPSAKPQSKSNDLLLKIQPSVADGKCYLNDIELMGVIRDARSVPDRARGFLVEGLAWIVKGEVDKGIDACEQSILLNSSDVTTWANYSVALSRCCKYAKAKQVILRSIDENIPMMLLHAFHYASRWADIDTMSKVLPMIEAVKADQSITGRIKDAIEQSAGVFNDMISMGDIAAQEMASMASVVMEIAEEEVLPMISSRIANDGDGSYAYIFSVDSLDHEHINRLDNMLFDRMIEKGIKSRHCIVFFESSAKENDNACEL